jgi:hypothetical protein
MTSHITFKVSIPTDEGFVGRECNNPRCTRYFRVHADDICGHMRCPYCGESFSNDQLHTQPQIQHLERAAEEQALEYMHGEIDKMFGNLAREFRGNSFVNFSYTPTRYRAKPVFPDYREKKVDTELQCPECSFRFQVYGIFGFCPRCGTENMLIYDANLAIIRRDIQNADNPRRALRHAYSDLVSTFQVFCAKKAKRFPLDKPSFQELFPAKKFFKDAAGVDILDTISDANLLTLRRVFQKRHACQHADGKVTDSYIKKMPEDKHLIGQDVGLSLEEFEDGARVLRHILDRLCRALEPKT